MPKKPQKTHELTPKQAEFVNIFIEKGTIQSAKQCAIDAGYSEGIAVVMASKLQNPNYYPHVVKELERRRAELNRRYSITYKNHIQKLAELRDNAEAAGNYTGAIAAEKYRGMVAGLYIDRKEIMHGTIDQMSVNEVEEKLIELRKKLSIPGEYEVIDQDTSEGALVGEPSDDIPAEAGELSIQDDT
jgi:phage terminase small subunit|tara:strand:- start:983 stop:1543 length:561 start_codon:yes stop_codon:yes gene_type:complete